MNWGKGLIIVLGLIQLSYVAHARDIESFTDSQGTLHITNTGPKQQGSPANPPSPAAPLSPGSLPGKAPTAFPARDPAPEAQFPVPNPEAPAPVPNSEAQAPAPNPEAVPPLPVPVDPQPGSRVTHPEGSDEVLAGRTGGKARPVAAASSGVRDSFDPRENILAGCRYFRLLLDYFQGNLLALAGYTAGYHRVISAGCQVPANKEPQEFVTQVMGLCCPLEKHVSGL